MRLDVWFGLQTAMPAGDAKTPQYDHEMPVQGFLLKRLQRSRGHKFHDSGIRMDTEADEADGTYVIVGRKPGPV